MEITKKRCSYADWMLNSKCYIWSFLTIGAVSKDIKRKENFKDNHFHDILALFDVLPNYLFPTN